MSKFFSRTPQHSTQSRKFVFPGDQEKKPIRRSASSLRLNEPKLDDYSAKKKKTLPDNFAEQLLDLELEMEKEDVNLDSVKRLIELYTEAMEYYESKKSDKHLVFMSKLQALLTKPNVIVAMTKDTTSKKTFEEQLAEEKDRKMEQFFKKTKQGVRNYRLDAGSIMRSHEETKTNVKVLISKSIDIQKNTMKRKLEQRKKLHLKRSDPSYVDADASERPTRRRGNSRDAEDGYQMHRRKSSAEVKQMVMAVFSNNEGSPDQAGKSQNRKFDLQKALEIALPEADQNDEDSEESSGSASPTNPRGINFADETSQEQKVQRISLMKDTNDVPEETPIGVISELNSNLESEKQTPKRSRTQSGENSQANRSLNQVADVPLVQEEATNEEPSTESTAVLANPTKTEEPSYQVVENVAHPVQKETSDEKIDLAGLAVVEESGSQNELPSKLIGDKQGEDTHNDSDKKATVAEQEETKTEQNLPSETDTAIQVESQAKVDEQAEPVEPEDHNIAQESISNGGTKQTIEEEEKHIRAEPEQLERTVDPIPEQDPNPSINIEGSQSEPPNTETLDNSAAAEENKDVVFEESKKQRNLSSGDASNLVDPAPSQHKRNSLSTFSGHRVSIRDRRESVLLEEAKSRLLLKMDADNAKQIEELRQKLEEEKEPKLNLIREKYRLARENMDAEMTSALLKKKLLQKSQKEEDEEISKFEEEHEGSVMKEVQKLKQRQKQQKLFKLTQLSV